MSEPTYYFINNTRREFCCFDNDYSIFEELMNAVNFNTGWTLQDDIRVHSEPPGSTVILKHLINDLHFVNLDHESSEEDSVPDSVA